MDFDDNSSESSESGEGWTRHVDESSGRVYWYHSGDMRSQWTCPPELETKDQKERTVERTATNTPEEEQDDEIEETQRIEVTEMEPLRAQGIMLNGTYAVQPTFAVASLRQQEIPEADKIRKKHIDQMVKQYHAMGQLVKQLQVNQEKQEQEWIQQQHIQGILRQQQVQKQLEVFSNHPIPPTALPTLPQHHWREERGIPPPSISQLAQSDYMIVPVVNGNTQQQGLVLPSPLSPVLRGMNGISASGPTNS